ncbi:hypothetical protein H4582DRAFT_2064414 [Lactarius indigo]|nr:hypothetical protein H4582DRAFT_2064414 [Lactarius indigo]
MDNYNTEQSEWLHIDFAKNAYCAINHKDKYTQMTGQLEHCEKISLHMAYIKWWQQSNNTTTQIPVPLGPLQVQVQYPKMTRHPSIKAASFKVLAERYVNHPGASVATLIKFTANISNNSVVDSAVIQPEQKDTHGHVIPSHFDTILVHSTLQDIHGNNGHQIAQLYVVFQLPKKVISDLFPGTNTSVPTHFAYVEWFSLLSATWDVNNLMYKVTRVMHGGQRHAAVILV